MDPRHYYYVDSRYRRRYVCRTVEEVARYLLKHGGVVGVSVGTKCDRDLAGCELRRLGQAIARVRDRELGEENANLAARLGLAS